MSAEPVRVVLVTVSDEDTAVSLARGLVEARLAACVNLVGGLRSIYRWQGAIEDDAEWLLIAKTTEARFEALRAHVVAHHPYDVPEVVALPILAGHAPYLDWVAAQV